MNIFFNKINVILLSLVLFSSCANSPKLKEKPPIALQDYVYEKFDNVEIIETVENPSEEDISYKLTLNQGTKLYFNKENKLLKAKSVTALPGILFPKKMYQYVLETYPFSVILEYKVLQNGYSIRLDNGMEVKFDTKNIEIK